MINQDHLRVFLFSFIVFILGSFFASSCRPEEEVKTLSIDELYGKWNMLQASRDGKLTETLKDSYFDFRAPDVLVNNINRKEQSYSFAYDGNVIQQRGTLDVDYNILKRSGDTILLGASIRNYEFKFLLTREIPRLYQTVAMMLIKMIYFSASFIE